MSFTYENGSISPELLALIENTHDMMFIKNRDFVYIAASRSYALDCVRCSCVEELIGKTDFELFGDQNIAARYRADDEKLLSTGRSMAEFQEEWPGKDGSKQLLLITKYLLHDRNGNPTAILGQLHDVGEQIEAEIDRRREMDRNMEEAMGRSFFAISYADLGSDKYLLMRATDKTKKILKTCDTLHQAFETFINTMVKEEYRERMHEFCEVETIADRLSGERQIDCDYLSTDESKWCRAAFLPVEWGEDGEVTHALFMVSKIDKVKAREIEEGIYSHKKLKQAYRERLNSLEKTNADAMCMCDINLTKNKFYNLHAGAIMMQCAERAATLDELLHLTSEAVYDPQEKQAYRTLFNCNALIECYRHGESHIKFEHFYRTSPNRTDIVETVFDLMEEPISGDIVGVCYARDMNQAKISNILLNASLDKDYPLVALVYADTGEYYLYEVDKGEYCTHKQHYWSDVYERLANVSDEKELAKIYINLTRKKITDCLKENEEFVYAFDGTYRGKRSRLEVKFRYVDKRHNLLVAALRNITDEALYLQYKYASEHDPLTGLYNRARVFQRSRELLQEHPEDQFVMLHFDIQHFHLYNTFFGEDGGNELLCKIADVFRYLAQKYEYLTYGRIESDVFCIFFPANKVEFEMHVRRSFEDLEEFSPDFPLRLSVGAYWVTDPEMSAEAMFTRATIAARSHKKNLFGLISRYDESMEQRLSDNQQITSEMTAAVEQEQFVVYLQPKYALDTEEMVGSEALVRWEHPERGMISPGKFIPTFEQNGFIADLDHYMWERVCRILRRWKDEGKPMYPISVNISRVSMYSHATVPFLKDLIQKYGLDPEYMELELTETAYMDDPEDLKRMLKELREFGFKILMDDFGSGYSSLNTLRELPVDVLKLDMKFLSESQNDPRANAVLSSVVRMSKMLNLPIVAEGVEKRAQADYLRDMGCEFVQGYLFAKPMPVNEYEKLLS